MARWVSTCEIFDLVSFVFRLFDFCQLLVCSAGHYSVPIRQIGRLSKPKLSLEEVQNCHKTRAIVAQTGTPSTSTICLGLSQITLKMTDVIDPKHIKQNTIMQCGGCMMEMFYRDVLEHCEDDHENWLGLTWEFVLTGYFCISPNQGIDLDLNPDYELGRQHKPCSVQRQQQHHHTMRLAVAPAHLHSRRHANPPHLQ